jgi:hypothetical protein
MDATHSDIPLVISAATLVELVYLVEKGIFMQTHLEAFHELPQLDLARESA